MTSHALIRPAWTPATIALMVGGFMLYWPLGLAVLAYILWGERLEVFRSDVNRSTDRVFSAFRRSGFGRGTPFTMDRTGNVAFNDWREAELRRLDEERRRLDSARADFEAYARELRRAKDQEEFERFMSSRRKPADQGPIVEG
ncbi:DUF2852 domain-containing protein [Aureimonas psammosilenae]|uniref:DUF2852 domain-containing protein n=1 Tax=Aureimonas psammosilenae TaxID=2495496 RepID=UPI00126136CB|nr:DUF2852 domain-containing protein [Aureimonas psammosilenae]